MDEKTLNSIYAGKGKSKVKAWNVNLKTCDEDGVTENNTLFASKEDAEAYKAFVISKIPEDLDLDETDITATPMKNGGTKIDIGYADIYVSINPVKIF